jgi:hypothetical protein
MIQGLVCLSYFVGYSRFFVVYFWFSDTFVSFFVVAYSFLMSLDDCITLSFPSFSPSVAFPLVYIFLFYLFVTSLGVLQQRAR